jgi:MFS family permease
VALALAAFGAGSMAAALTLPPLIERVGDRSFILGSGAALAGVTLIHGAFRLVGLTPGWTLFLCFWLLTGAFYGAVLTPGGRLLRRSAAAEDRPALYTAHFALSHVCWLLTYPLAGFLMTLAGPGVTLVLMGALAASGVVLAARFWPAPDADALEHEHPGLDPADPHLAGHERRHAHAFVIDDRHPRWPTQG